MPHLYDFLVSGNSYYSRLSSTIFPSIAGEVKHLSGHAPKRYKEKVHLRWGSSSLELNIPEGWHLHYPEEPPSCQTMKDENEIVSEALANPVESARLGERNLSGKRILIIVDDNTRPTPVDRFLSVILDELEAAGAKDILLMPALGIHSPMTSHEIEQKIGRENMARAAWKNHDAFDSSQMQNFGTTSKGVRIGLNREIGTADLILLIGLIEPHMWAGFGGGLKNILPGLASAECIGNHHHIISEPPYRFCRVGMMPEENSFRLSLEETRRMIPADIFCFNVVLNHAGKIAGAFSGDPVKAHRQGVGFCAGQAGRVLDRHVDGVIASSFPMDTNFKQSMKGVGNSLGCLRPGGVVMGFLKAEKGLDDIKISDRTMPLTLLRLILRTIGPAGILKVLERNRPGMNPEEKFLAYYSLQLLTHHDVYLYVPSLSDSEFRSLAIYQRYDNPQEVISRAWATVGGKAHIAVLNDAGATYPVVKNI